MKHEVRHNGEPVNDSTQQQEPPSGPPEEDLSEAEAHHLPELPQTTRIVLLAAGSGFLLLGLIGLALPVVPQAAFLLVGAALLSVASKRVHAQVDRWLNRWPAASDAFARMRLRIHGWVAPRHKKSVTPPDERSDD